MRKPAVIAAVTLAGVLSLAGCEDGPDCVDWTVQTTIQTTFVNGKASTHPVTQMVCVRWEQPKK